jgi:hypothetical protein
VSPLFASVAARADDAQPRTEAASAKVPSEEKLDRAKREIVEAMTKVRLANSDGPALPPRPRRRR